MRYKKRIFLYAICIFIVLFILRYPLAQILRFPSYSRPPTTVQDESVQDEPIWNAPYLDPQFLDAPFQDAPLQDIAHAKNTKKERNIQKQSHNDGRKLLLVQVLFRHGHSSPLHPYTNDPNPRKVWKEGLGHLTDFGCLQSQDLGDQLRTRYRHFLSNDSNEVDCLSSEEEPCVTSAACLLSTFHPDDKMDGSQLIPVYSQPAKYDKYLPSFDQCLEEKIEMSQIMEESESADFIKKHEKLYNLWSNHSGEEIRCYETAEKLFENLNSEKMLNLTLPTWAKRTWKKLQHQADMFHYFRFKTIRSQRLKAGPLLELMIKRMLHNISDLQTEKKIYLYSGFGTTISAILHALDLFNMKAPPYTSYIVIELYSGSKGANHWVRFLFSDTLTSGVGTTRPAPKSLLLPGCPEYCPLEYFIQSTQHITPDNWEKECHSIE